MPVLWPIAPPRFKVLRRQRWLHPYCLPAKGRNQEAGCPRGRAATPEPAPSPCRHRRGTGWSETASTSAGSTGADVVAVQFEELRLGWIRHPDLPQERGDRL